MMTPIPQEWIQKYVNELLEAAKMFGLNTDMGRAAMLRADNVMDMVKAFRERKE